MSHTILTKPDVADLMLRSFKNIKPETRQRFRLNISRMSDLELLLELKNYKDIRIKWLSDGRFII